MAALVALCRRAAAAAQVTGHTLVMTHFTQPPIRSCSLHQNVPWLPATATRLKTIRRNTAAGCCIAAPLLWWRHSGVHDCTQLYISRDRP